MIEDGELLEFVECGDVVNSLPDRSEFVGLEEAEGAGVEDGDEGAAHFGDELLDAVAGDDVLDDKFDVFDAVLLGDVDVGSVWLELERLGVGKLEGELEGETQVGDGAVGLLFFLVAQNDAVVVGARGVDVHERVPVRDGEDGGDVIEHELFSLEEADKSG